MKLDYKFLVVGGGVVKRQQEMVSKGEMKSMFGLRLNDVLREEELGKILSDQVAIKRGESVKIMRTEPSADETVNRKLDVIRVMFDQLIDLDKMNIQLNPVILGETLINKGEMSVSFYPLEILKSGQWYEVMVYKGDQLIYVWQITTGEEKLRSIGMEQLDNFQKENYPLVNFLPYESLNYKIEYVGRKKIKVLVLTQEEVSIEEIANWIRDHGVDPKTHEIEWAFN